MLKLFLYRKVTGLSYRALSRRQELAGAFGLDRIPDESVLSRTWRKRFDESIHEFITTAARFLVKEIHDGDLEVPEVRSKEEVITAQKDGSSDSTGQDDSTDEFTATEIYQTTRLVRTHGFGSFDSGRAENARYEDVRFFELQTFMGMVGCGAAQGAARFQIDEAQLTVHTTIRTSALSNNSTRRH